MVKFVVKAVVNPVVKAAVKAVVEVVKNLVAIVLVVKTVHVQTVAGIVVAMLAMILAFNVATARIGIVAVLHLEFQFLESILLPHSL